MKIPAQLANQNRLKVVCLAAFLLFSAKAGATTFSNPYWPINYGILTFNWKIYSGSTFTGWVEPDGAVVGDEIQIDDEDCGCPSEEFTDCWARADSASEQWQIW